MRILITGAAGFIGKHVLKALAQDRHDLLLLLRSGPKDFAAPTGGRVVHGDLGAVESYSRQIKTFAPEACVHLAWGGIPDYSAAVSVNNLEDSIRFLAFVIGETPCKKIVASGSCFEYGKKQGICIETDEATKESYFSWAKNSLSRYLSLKCRESGIDYVWFRFFYVYGPGQRKNTLIPSLIGSFSEGKQPAINTPFDANDFIYAGDVGQAIRNSIVRKMESGIYNLGAGSSTKIIDVCEIVEKLILGTNTFSLSIKRRCPPDRPVDFWADMSKTTTALAWAPGKPLKTGIQECLKTGNAS